MKSTYDWFFPLTRTHTGMLLGNAITGAMVWGGGNVLNITLNRADHWDHRGGKPWTPAMNYRDIRRLLKAADERGLRKIFEPEDLPPGMPRRPTMLPLGRLEFQFPRGSEIRRGTLHLATGHIALALKTRDGLRTVRLEMAAAKPVLHVQLPSDIEVDIRRVPAWRYVGEHLRAVSFTEPVLFDSDELSGWVQDRPADDPICLGYRQRGRSVWVAVEYGSDSVSARSRTGRAIDRAAGKGVRPFRAGNKRWWARYWTRTPTLRIPNARLRFMYEYGMYKFAGLTAPHGIAASLQGPWIEEYQLPPWSSDYHFNINVQMCYWPAYPGNHLANLRPILDLVWSWRDKLRKNARLFIGVRDGYMLPHAVDDRGTCMGGFWTGTLDHGCTAWVAKMMYDYWLYGGDKGYLRDVAYPFMKGTMRVYEALLEKRDVTYALPVGVSPEYGGAGMDAWGEDASFQLAAIHWLIEALQNASRALRERPRPVWKRIQDGLPRACVGPGSVYSKSSRVMLWKGQDLEFSHRHHSHLAGFYPFDVIEPSDPEWRDIASSSCRWWNRMGMGMWTGWCVPWASMLQTRIGIPEMTELLLEYWERLFTNEGHGTLHDPPTWTREKMLLLEQKAKQSAVAGGFGEGRGEIMQIEAGMAAAAAVMDMLIHVRRGIHHVFAGVPQTWRDAEFTGIRTEGGFLVSAALREGAPLYLRVRSTVDATFRVANPWGEGTRVSVRAKGKTATRSAGVIALRLSRGTSATIHCC